MTIWAIADIHASPVDGFGRLSKPMEIFGDNWKDHVDRIEAAWNDRVADTDTVVVVGDIDWSLHLSDAVQTLGRIAGWRGIKILVRGNHDYWWSSDASSKVRKVLPPGMMLLHNNSFEVEGWNLVGTKGSTVPGTVEWTETDAKLLNRELGRLRLSLATRNPALPTIAAIHYPPYYPSLGSNPYVDVLRDHGVSVCVYGHLHGAAAESGPRGEHDGIRYVLAAADHVNFEPIPLV
ncbi:MAG TPA: metallophosphoesterase [Chloroflexota bacterium]|jgi:hypothetical protein|nr:metallophosphoesterase [Chloroflexota bacterium]